MANKPITMLQIRRLLQLHGTGASARSISRSLGIHRNTVAGYLEKIKSDGRTAGELQELDDGALGRIFINQPPPVKDDRYKVLEKMFPYIGQELGKTGVTRRLLWEEYRTEHPEGYGYAQFCEHLSGYSQRGKATMHLDHRPGEYLQIDFAGKKLGYIEKSTGEVISCPVLVCTLPYSNYTYVEALASSRQEELFAALNRCLNYLGGVPKNILSDNMKQYVKKNDRYEFTFQELADQWCVHYNTNLDATRPRKPKDKPSVENHVYVSYLRIYAKIRAREFYSLGELNREIKKRLEELNNTDFQKLPGSRRGRFLDNEKNLLSTLPNEEFVVKRTTNAKVQMNYHVVLGEDRHQYSVPYQYIGKQTKIVYDHQDVEIFIGMERIAAHPRSYRRNYYTTKAEHMPEKHLRYQETRGWDADYFLQMASKTGPFSKEYFKKVLDSKDFVEQTYRACLG
jgi:transposase